MTRLSPLVTITTGLKQKFCYSFGPNFKIFIMTIIHLFLFFLFFSIMCIKTKNKNPISHLLYYPPLMFVSPSLYLLSTPPPPRSAGKIGESSSPPSVGKLERHHYHLQDNQNYRKKFLCRLVSRIGMEEGYVVVYMQVTTVVVNGICCHQWRYMFIRVEIQGVCSYEFRSTNTKKQ